MKPSVEETVLSVLKQRGALPDEHDEMRQTDYVESGLVDSLGLMNLVTELETIFDVELEEDDFMQANFRTIGGLIDIMNEVVER